MAHDDSFEGFVVDSYPRLVRTAFLLTADRGHAEDLAQTALLRTYVAWGRLRELANAEAYARTVIIRLASRWRRRKWRGESPVAELEMEAGPDRTSEVDVADLALRCLAALSLSQRSVLVLRYYEGLSEIETARVLRCRPGTVKSRSARAIAVLRSSGLLADEDIPAPPLDREPFRA